LWRHVVNFFEIRPPKPNSLLLLYSLTATIFFVVLLILYFEPRWETNDDVAMSMIAHGYGIAVKGHPPTLMFSNILWGYIVRAIPEIKGILGYSLATLAVLVISGSAITYGMFRLGLGYVGCLSSLVLLFARPILFPQFTINAGLLMVAAIVCANLYIKKNDMYVLLAGCFFAFISYLVRSQEFLLVLIVALPVTPWRALFLNTYARKALFLLLSTIAVSAFIDHQAYQGAGWKPFNDLNPVRAFFTDFGAGEYLKKRPEILQQHGYSFNDVDLVTHWFFTDKNVANPKVLLAMLNELGPLPVQVNAFNNACIGVQALWHPVLLTTVLAALLLAVLRPSWNVVVCWGMCIAAVFILGLLGRPGILRIYVPLTCLLLILPSLVGKISGWRKHLTAGVLLIAAIVNSTIVFSESKTLQNTAIDIRKNFATFPNYPVIIWGNSFPYQDIYTPYRASRQAMLYKHFGLGTSTLAPFSLANLEQSKGYGMNLFIDGAGASIMLNRDNMKMLENYCTERFQGKFKLFSTKQYGSYSLNKLSCDLNQ
jgi:hypothetical protein